jgi:hypothetical protein
MRLLVARYHADCDRDGHAARHSFYLSGVGAQLLAVLDIPC